MCIQIFMAWIYIKDTFFKYIYIYIGVSRAISGIYGIRVFGSPKNPGVFGAHIFLPCYKFPRQQDRGGRKAALLANGIRHQGEL